MDVADVIANIQRVSPKVDAYKFFMSNPSVGIASVEIPFLSRIVSVQCRTV